MFAMKRWLRSNFAKAFVTVLLGIQIVPIVQACPMPMLDVSMAYASAEMPEACAGMARHTCLVAYIQADRAFGNDTDTIVAPPAVMLRVAALGPVAVVERDGAPSASNIHSGAPPPRLLHWRMLN